MDILCPFNFMINAPYSQSDLTNILSKIRYHVSLKLTLFDVLQGQRSKHS